MQKEIWKDIKGYEGLYQISNLGNVKSLEKEYKYGKKYSRIRKMPEMIITFKIDKDGYYVARLSKNGKKKDIFAHRLVADAFIPNPNNYTIVNHKDENKQNNNVENLEWCTSKYNFNYSRTRKKLVSILENIEKYLYDNDIDSKTKNDLLKILNNK